MALKSIVNCNFQLHLYPWDEQECEVMIMASVLYLDKLCYEINKADISLLKKKKISVFANVVRHIKYTFGNQKSKINIYW